MIASLRNISLAKPFTVIAAWAQVSFVSFLVKHRMLGAAVLASALSVLYWGLIASSRYISEAHVIVQQTDLAGAAGMDVTGLLGVVGGGNNADQMLVRDYLLSVDMLKALDKKLNLRAHFSDWHRDPLSRMWFEDTPIEYFHSHYLSRVSVEFDASVGVVIIRAQAYEPEVAHAITSMLVLEGERFMNAMAHSLAEDQVAFLETQVAAMRERVMEARRAVVDFQNNRGMVSPQTTAENIVAIVNSLEAQLAEVQTRRVAMLGYLMPDSSNVVELNMQIAAIKAQIAKQNARLASRADKALNGTVEEYQRLELNAEFAQDVYKTALVALEKGRIEATRTLKKVSVPQSPTKPQLALEPRRLYNIVVFVLFSFLVAGVVHLLASIIRDHKD